MIFSFSGSTVFDRARRQIRTLLIACWLLPGLSACDSAQQAVGIEPAGAKLARLDAEGKAVGGACRQSGRAIEDCYSIYSWLPKSSIYEGWRDMDIYMRENKLETVEPQLPPPQPPGSRKKKAAAEPVEGDGRSGPKAASKE